MNKYINKENAYIVACVIFTLIQMNYFAIVKRVIAYALEQKIKEVNISINRLEKELRKRIVLYFK